MALLQRLLAVAILLGFPQPAFAQQFVMKLSTPTINDVTHEWMKAFKTGVESRSNGRIKVEIYPANQLGQIPATVDGVVIGTIELTTPAVGFFIGLEPRFQVLDAAGLFDSIEHGQKVLNDPDTRARLSTFGDAKGVEPLFTFLNGPLVALSHKPIRSSKDFSGQKIRVPGPAPLHIEPFKKLGVSPVSMPLGEVLPAMQNRTIDGLISAFTVLTAFKYYDVAKEATYLPGSFLIASGLVNRKFMKSLGPELEAIVRDEARKHEALFTGYNIQDVERIRAVWEKNGGNVITFSPEEAKQYLSLVTSVTPAIIARNPKMKEDYEALTATANKYR
jgi:TRAP-type C4-dicarboxylate transport system substrate-binding protein